MKNHSKKALSLTALDHQILKETEGKEIADKVMLLAAAFKKTEEEKLTN